MSDIYKSITVEENFHTEFNRSLKFYRCFEAWTNWKGRQHLRLTMTCRGKAWPLVFLIPRPIANLAARSFTCSYHCVAFIACISDNFAIAWNFYDCLSILWRLRIMTSFWKTKQKKNRTTKKCKQGKLFFLPSLAVLNSIKKSGLTLGRPSGLKCITSFET